MTLARKSILERLADEGEARLAAGGPVPAAPEPTAVHRKAAEVLSNLIGYGLELASANQGSAPAILTGLMRVIKSSQGMMLEQLAAVPPAEIKAWMQKLRDDIDSILEVEE